MLAPVVCFDFSLVFSAFAGDCGSVLMEGVVCLAVFLCLQGTLQVTHASSSLARLRASPCAWSFRHGLLLTTHTTFAFVTSCTWLAAFSLYLTGCALTCWSAV